MHRPRYRTDIIRIARSHQHYDNPIKPRSTHFLILGATKK
jgi:hypothetical protein